MYVNDLFISVSLMNGFTTYSLNPMSLSRSPSVTRSQPARTHHYISFQLDSKCILLNDFVSQILFSCKNYPTYLQTLHVNIFKKYGPLRYVESTLQPYNSTYQNFTDKKSGETLASYLIYWQKNIILLITKW